MPRTRLIAGNWKLNGTISEAMLLANTIAQGIDKTLRCEVVIAPVFTALAAVRSVLGQHASVGLGGQNCYWEDRGAFTGEVSAALLADAGCSHVIVGHSERRQYFAETNDIVAKKIMSVLQHGMMPIVCIGESLKEREEGKAQEVVTSQLQGSLAGLAAADVNRCVIAYEPIWAIGTGRIASTRDAQAMHEVIRIHLKNAFSADLADTVRILYGGSVNEANVSELLSARDIDGALVGGASLKADSFLKIIAIAQQSHKES